MCVCVCVCARARARAADRLYNSSNTVKATDFKFDMHICSDSLVYTHEHTRIFQHLKVSDVETTGWSEKVQHCYIIYYRFSVNFG